MEATRGRQSSLRKITTTKVLLFVDWGIPELFSTHFKVKIVIFFRCWRSN